MTRDPHYLRIIAALNGQLDPALFERCIADVLRTAFPTLVPIRGGDDAGMDGAVADGEAEAFPLVCTIREDVIGNLTASLDSHVSRGYQARKVVLATSRPLTQRKRKNLENRAREKGFLLVQVFDQAALADRLYYSPAWCRELLNLAGAPPALSAIPRTARPLLSGEIIGREADTGWLRALDGDALLVGQPGSGKTCLLHRLAVEGWGLFAVSDDRAGIADALREQRPGVVAVDDAHVSPDLLLSLRQVRAETGIPFAILATSWPGEADAVAEALGVPAGRVRALDLLDRDQMVQVVRGAGVYGPDELVRHLVDQSEGRPGLAVTLAHLCLQGGIRDVVTGTALSRSVRVTFERLVGRAAHEILAALSVGGRGGIAMADAARELDLPVIEFRRAVAGLTAGGVVREAADGAIAVAPSALRHALLRDVFFSGPARLPAGMYRSIAACAPDRTEAARTIVGASACGGGVPDDLLVSSLADAGSSSAWAEYAALGPGQAGYVLGSVPTVASDHPWAFLHFVPERTIPLLLGLAVGDRRPLNSAVSHPLRVLQDWVESAEPESPDVPRRREALASASASWLSSGGDPEIALRSACLSLSPRYHTFSADPGRGRTVTFTRGTIAAADVETVGRLWPAVLAVIRGCPDPEWRHVASAVEDFVFPGRSAPEGISDDVRAAMETLAGRMLGDLVPLLLDRPGPRQWAVSMAEHLGADLGVGTDADYEALFPRKEAGGDRREAYALQSEAARALGREWSGREPSEVARRIGFLERDALAAGHNWPRHTPVLCLEIAGAASEPLRWAEALVAERCAADLVLPFLSLPDADWEPEREALISRLLDDPQYEGAAAGLVLSSPAPPGGLLDAAVAKLGRWTQWVETLCLRGEVSEPILRVLLRSDDPEVAFHAAVGLWATDPEGTVTASLEASWRDAVLLYDGDLYRLLEILDSDRDMAKEWLTRRASQAGEGRYLQGRDMLFAVARTLDAQAKAEVIAACPANYEGYQILEALVADDPAAYRILLAEPRLAKYHLSPLGSLKDEDAWSSKARLALDAGYPPADVARALFPLSMSWSGPESAMWSEWASRFGRLEEDANRNLSEVGRLGKVEALRREARAASEERIEDVYGNR
jgi:hypothetical protein